MFKVGDKVVYPMHGAGVIEAIEEREFLGEKRQYYVMRMPIGDMKVMVPTDSTEEVGLRRVMSRDDVEQVLSILKSKRTKMSNNWNRRYRANMEKIKSGSAFEVAEVVRNLIQREQEKGLSSGEKKMLDSARQILVSELVLAQNIDEEEAESLVDQLAAN
ncbi:MAG: CarD family transcriptional regulator [Firmicutes bacterium]|nr:CarD family transcriptional regulator [Bacillota bacterium]